MVVREELTPLEVAFSPSCFPDDPNLNPDQVVVRFVKALEDSLRENRDSGVERKEDVPYEGEGGQHVDFWGPTSTANRVFITLHGGYWQEGDRKYFTTMVKPLVDAGITVAVVGYDMAIGKPLRSVIEQVKRSITFILGSCPDATFSLGGHSAGAHLAAVAASEMSENDRLTDLVLICGVYKLDELVDTYIGRGIQLTTEMAANCNLDKEKLIAKFGNKKIWFLNSEFDAKKLKIQNEELETWLRANGAKVNSVEVKGVDHFSIIENLRFKGHSACKAVLDAVSLQ